MFRALKRTKSKTPAERPKKAKTFKTDSPRINGGLGDSWNSKGLYNSPEQTYSIFILKAALCS